MRKHRSKIRPRTVLLAGFTLAGAGLALAQPPGPTASPAQPSLREEKVEAFVAAFNARDLEALLALADDEIEWLSVSKHEIGVEARGKTALRESLEGYFQSCSSCRSELEWTRLAGSRVVALERASWERADGPASQRSLSVYEFDGDRITRVYYFPSEP
jgi:hypothetical protein